MSHFDNQLIPLAPIEAPRKTRGPLSLWYRLTSPPEPDELASLQERELFRRGRTGSQISILLFLLMLISYPAAFAGSNPLLVTLLTVNIVFLACAMLVNRLKFVTLAGVMMVLGTVATPTANIVTSPGGISTDVLTIFGFLVLPLMCAVSVLPTSLVFIVAGVNTLFTIFALLFLPSSGELHTLLQEAAPGVVTPILLSQWIVAAVAFLWVRGAKNAIQRADRAEEIIKLQEEIDQHLLDRARQKEQLESSVRIIEQVHANVANGNLSARVPLNNGNILWSVSGQLNNLLTRHQQLYIDVHQLRQQQAITEQIALENAQLRAEIRRRELADQQNIHIHQKGKTQSSPLPFIKQ